MFVFGDDVFEELLVDDAVVALLLQLQPEQGSSLGLRRRVVGVHLVVETTSHVKNICCTHNLLQTFLGQCVRSTKDDAKTCLLGVHLCAKMISTHFRHPHRFGVAFDVQSCCFTSFSSGRPADKSVTPVDAASHLQHAVVATLLLLEDLQRFVLVRGRDHSVRNLRATCRA